MTHFHPIPAGDRPKTSNFPFSRFAMVKLVSLSLMICLAGVQNAEARPARVAAVPVIEAPLATDQVVNGRLSLTREQLISARLDAVVRSINVDPGDLVTADSILMQLDTPDAVDDSVQLELDIKLDQSRLRELDNDLGLERDALQIAMEQASILKAQSERTVRLGSNVAADIRDAALSNSLNAQLQVINRQASLNRLEEQQQQVQLALQKNQAELSALKRDLGNRTVTSGVAGYVSALDIQPGETVESDQVLAHVLPLDSLVAEIAVVPGTARLLRAGQQLQVELEDDRYAASFHSALPSLDPRSGLQTVFLKFENPANVPFVLNLPLQVRIPKVTDSPVTLVPQDAIVPKGSRAFVFIADGEVARQVEVTLGRISGDQVNVLSGLSVGDMVIVRGNETLTDGQQITTGGGKRPAGGNGRRPSSGSGN